MDNEQDLVNLSISLTAKDVNVKDTFTQIKKELDELSKQFSDSLGASSLSKVMSEMSELSKDISTMATDIKKVSQQMSGLSNNIKSTAQQMDKIASSKAFQQVQKDVSSSNKVMIDFKAKALEAFQSIGKTLSSLNYESPFTQFFVDTERMSQHKASIETIVSLYDGLMETLKQGEAMGVDSTSDSFQNLLSIIYQLEEEIYLYNQAINQSSTASLKVGDLGDVGVLRTSLYAIFSLIDSLGYKFNEFKSIISTSLSSASASVKSFASEIQTRFPNLTSAVSGFANSIVNMGSTAFNGIKNGISTFASGIKNVVNNISNYNKQSKSTISNSNSFLTSIKRLAKTLVVYRLALTAVTSAIRTFGSTLLSCLKQNDSFVSSLNNIKANLAVAFMPIYNTILPAINALMNALASITRVIASLFATVFGSSYEKLLAQANALFGAISDTSEAESDSASAVEDKADAYEKQLLAVDEINNLTTDEDTSSSSGSSSGGTSSSYEELEGFGINVDSLKAKLEELFQPIKNSWEKYGKSVLENAKYMLNSIWELIKTIGVSFETVWLNGTGEQTFDYIFQILANILGIIGDIATALKTAWNENNTGTQIVQALWNAFNNLLGIVLDFTTAIRSWSQQADFTNFMNSVLNLSLAFENLTATLRDKLAPVFNTYITPVLNKLTEEIIPSLIDGLTTLVNFFSEHLGVLGALVASVVGVKMISAFSSLSKALSNSSAFGIFRSALSGVTTVASSGLSVIGGWLTSLGGLASQIPIVNSHMGVISATLNGLGTAFKVATSPITLFAGAFFYLMGTSETFSEWVNSILNGIEDLISGIDFSSIGTKVSEGIQSIFTTISTGIDRLDWGSLAGIFSTAMAGVFDFVGGIDFASITQGLSDLVNSIMTAIAEYIAGFDFMSVGESLGTMVANLMSSLLDFILNFDWLSFLTSIVTIVIETLGGLFDLIGSAIVGFLESILGDGADSVSDLWENYLQPFGDWVTGTFTDIWNTLTDLFNEYVVPAFEAIGDIASTIWNDYLKPFINWIGSTVIDILDEILIPVIKNVVTAFQNIGEKVKYIWDTYLSPFINWIANTFKPLFDTAIEGIKYTFENLSSSISSIISGIKSIISGIITFISGVFTGDWEKAWEGVKTIFSGIWDAFYGIVKTPINLVIGLINKMISGIESGINYVISAINKISFDVPSWVPIIGGKTFGFNLSKVSLGRIPTLAEGGIAYGDTLVNVGEYATARTNPEVIGKLSDLNGMIYDNIVKAISNGNSSQYSPDDYDIVTEITLKTDSETLAKEVSRGKAKIERKTGKPLFSY